MQSIASRTTNVPKATMAYWTLGRARKSSRDFTDDPGNAHECQQAPAQGGEATGARGRTGNQVEALAPTQSTWQGKRPSGAAEYHARRRSSVESRHCHYHRSVGCVSLLLLTRCLLPVAGRAQSQSSRPSSHLLLSSPVVARSKHLKFEKVTFHFYLIICWVLS